jgi:hypothetical protein
LIFFLFQRCADFEREWHKTPAQSKAQRVGRGLLLGSQHEGLSDARLWAAQGPWYRFFD